MTKTDPRRRFLRAFYPIYTSLGAAGCLVAVFFGTTAFASYFFGLLLLGFNFVSWAWAIAIVLDPDHPSPSLGYLAILLHFGLLGGLFYAMISLFAVNWIWFVIGSLILLPSLVITALFFYN